MSAGTAHAPSAIFPFGSAFPDARASLLMKTAPLSLLAPYTIEFLTRQVNPLAANCAQESANVGRAVACCVSCAADRRAGLPPPSASDAFRATHSGRRSLVWPFARSRSRCFDYVTTGKSGMALQLHVLRCGKVRACILRGDIFHMRQAKPRSSRRCLHLRFPFTPLTIIIDTGSTWALPHGAAVRARRFRARCVFRAKTKHRQEQSHVRLLGRAASASSAPYAVFAKLASYRA